MKIVEESVIVEGCVIAASVAMRAVLFAGCSAMASLMSLTNPMRKADVAGFHEMDFHAVSIVQRVPLLTL